MVITRPAKGLTLLELVLSIALLSVIFLGITASYVTALKFFNSLRQSQNALDTLIAFEGITRKIELANRAVVDDMIDLTVGAQLKLRWDFSWNAVTGAFTPNHTPENIADDTWIKYRFFDQLHLRWRVDSAEAGDVQNSDPEIDANLERRNESAQSLDMNGFELTSPSGDGESTVVVFRMVTMNGQPAAPFQLVAEVMTGAQAKN